MGRVVALSMMFVSSASPCQEARSDIAVPTQPKYEAVRGYAACVSRRDPDRVKALMDTDQAGGEPILMARKMAKMYDNCIPGRDFLSFPLPLLLGAFAEATFEADPALLDRATHMSPITPERPDPAKIDAAAAKLSATDREEFFSNMFRAEFARCLAQSAPSDVAKILPTKPGSQQERAVIVAFGDHLSDCMPEGISYQLVPVELRPYLMFALHHAALHDRKGA